MFDNHDADLDLFYNPCRNKMGHLIYSGVGVYLGNPTRLAPIPKPAPPLAELAMDGMKTSRTLKVAAAVRPMMTTSSMFRRCLGME